MLDDDRRATRFDGGHLASGEDRPIGEIDRKNLVLSKAIVAQHGWPTFALIGAVASHVASTILLHSADHGWQKQFAPEPSRIPGTSMRGEQNISLPTVSAFRRRLESMYHIPVRDPAQKPATR